MKKIFTIIAAGAFALIGTSTTVEARPNGGYNHQSSSTTYISGYRHGRPIYSQKIFVGYDRYGHPRFEYRTVSAPVYRGRSHHYTNSYSCPPTYNTRSHYDDRRRSGSSISFRFGR